MTSFRSLSSLATGTGTNMVLTKPAGVVDGDLLFAVLGFYISSPGVDVTSVPSGWTLLRTATTPSHRTSVYWKIAASEPSTWTFVTGSSLPHMWSCVAVSSPVSPYISDSNYRNDGPSNVTTHSAASVNAGSASDMLMFISSGRITSNAWTPPSGYTEQLDLSYADGSGVSNTMLVATKEPSGASGATGPVSSVSTFGGVVENILIAVTGGPITPIPGPAVPAYKSSGANVTANPSPNVPIPAGVVAGDLLLMHAYGNGTIATPAGWTLQLGPITMPGAANNYFFTKVSAGSEAATVTVTGSTYSGGKIGVFSGVNPSAPIDVKASTTSVSSQSFGTSPSVTTTQVNTLIARLACMPSAVNVVPATGTERYDSVDGTFVFTTELVTDPQYTVGASGTVNLDFGSGTGAGVLAVFALAPLSVPSVFVPQIAIA